MPNPVGSGPENLEKEFGAMKARLSAACLCVCAMLVHPIAEAQQNYPERPVTIVAPSAPGGLYSIFARLMIGRAHV